LKHGLFLRSEYVKFKFSYSDAHAAATASVAQILPVVLMPFLGVCVDRHGKRTWMSKCNMKAETNEGAKR
jgi:MFS-type transporter involved in bile tolerance (Atg22 family)